MDRLKERILQLTYQILFTAGLALLFWWRGLAESQLAGKLVLLQNQLLVGKRYDRWINLSARWYGLALEQAVNQAVRFSDHRISTIVDCGTGTGFVSLYVAKRFPDARIVAVDGIHNMLKVARENIGKVTNKGTFVRAELRMLPLGTGIADLVIAQNTIPVLREFARICRPGGVVVFAESGVPTLAPVARRAAERLKMFDLIEASRAGAGFFLVARRK
jgi:SAM-dependent methyltransferase